MRSINRLCALFCVLTLSGSITLAADCRWMVEAHQDGEVSQEFLSLPFARTFSRRPEVIQINGCEQKVCLGLTHCVSEPGVPASLNIAACKTVGQNDCPTADQCLADPDITLAAPYPTLEDVLRNQQDVIKGGSGSSVER
jgi:hypothetical protein